MLKNFLGGIIVLFEGSVRPGDWVEIAGTEGEIDKLSIRSTTVRTLDDVEYIVPNQDWFSGTVKTFTRSNRFVRARIPSGVGKGADPRVVQQMLVETARRHLDVMAEPPPAAPLLEFKVSTMSFVLRSRLKESNWRSCKQSWGQGNAEMNAVLAQAAMSRIRFPVDFVLEYVPGW